MKLFEIAIPIISGFQIVRVEAKDQENAIANMCDGEIQEYEALELNMNTKDWDIQEM